MAKMILTLSSDEFKKKVNYFRQQLPANPEPIEVIVDFLQAFMINPDNELKFGHYDYELQIDGRSISLDDPGSEAELRKLVEEALRNEQQTCRSSRWDFIEACDDHQ